MKIVIFSGTTEGRNLSCTLAKTGVPILVCVATEYGRMDQGNIPGIQVQAGRLDCLEMEKLLGRDCLCVDATHPYAKQATQNIRAAAQQAGAVYLRLLRPASDLPEDCRVVEDAFSAAGVLQGTQGNILLTTGAKELAAFTALGTDRLFARVLPLESSLASCRRAKIPVSQIIAMQGPFGEELNKALFHQFSIRWLVTKDGGGPGGFAEKVQAAKECGVKTIVIRRPIEQGQSYKSVLDFCKEWIAQCR